MEKKYQVIIGVGGILIVGWISYNFWSQYQKDKESENLVRPNEMTATKMAAPTADEVKSLKEKINQLQNELKTSRYATQSARDATRNEMQGYIEKLKSYGISWR